jgi:hypothetical protein
MEMISPIDGDMMHARDGITTDKGLRIKVTLAADPGSRIRVGDVQAVYKDGLFTAEALLTEYENHLELRNEITGETKDIKVYRLKNFAGGYRLSIDDNIWFLRDIYNHAGTYKSIFDNSYLRFLKALHDTYGTKVHLNLFYETDGFNLSQLSDEFKEEWSAQSSWLRLSFHALGEFPDMPYKTAGYDQVKRDCDLVMKEIRRFAGPAVMGPMTTVHWGELTVEGARAIRDAGYKGLLGYFNVDNDLPPVSFYFNVEERRHMRQRWVWKDARTDIVFVKTSVVLDKTALADIRPYLDSYAMKDNKPPYTDLLVHEQYYYPFYEVYQPDYKDRLTTAVQWAVDNGYVPKFLEECIL